MSHIKIIPKQQFAQATSKQSAPISQGATVLAHHVLIEAVPVPVGTNEYDPEKVGAQADALRNFRTTAKDIFEANECATPFTSYTSHTAHQSRSGTPLSTRNAKSEQSCLSPVCNRPYTIV